MKIKLSVKRVVVTVVIAILMYFTVPYLFVGNILKQDIKSSKQEEDSRIQKILEDNPDVAKKLRAWQNGEIELTDEEHEEIHRILHPQDKINND